MIKNEASKLKALSDIASIEITLEFKEILHNILKITCETMNAHSGTIMLVDEKDNELRMVASFGLPQGYIERVYETAKKAGVPITSSPSGTALRTGNYIAVPDVYKEPKDKPWHHLSKELGFSAQIYNPMKRGLKTIGLLNIYMAEPHQFTDEEINFLTIAASQASSVVQNARMCSSLRDNVLELKEHKEHLEEKIEESNKRLLESEKYFKTILESSLDGIAVIDEQGRFEFGNDALFNILGWARDELIGQHFMRVIPENAKEFTIRIWQEVQSGCDGLHEIKIKTRLNEIRYLHISSSSIEIGGKKRVAASIRDITEQKKLEMALKESEERYRDLFENANDSFYIYDAKGYFKEVNNTALKLLRCTREEIIGTNISEWITPESLKRTRDLLKKQYTGEHIEEPIIVEVISKWGEHRWMEIRRRLIKDGDRLIEVHGMGRDITEKVILEQELRESEAKYKDLFENADDPMFTVDTEGNFMALNHAGLKLLGYTKDEIIGTHISGWLTHESFKIAQIAISKRMMGQPVDPSTVLELVCKNKEIRLIDVKSRILGDGDKVIGLHGIARDITEKRKLEQQLKEYHEKLERSYEELKEAEARYRDLFENAEDPMYIIDTEGYFKGINNAGLRILGGTREEVISSHISEWLTHESFKVSQEILIKQISGLPYEQPVTVEVICKNGEHRWGDIRTRLIKKDNRVIEIHGIARDITEKRILEQRLREFNEKLKKSYEELIEADRLKTEFISNITHELFTPLTAIKGFTELLFDETTGKINSEQRKSLEIILRNSDRLIRLIKDLLDVANLEKNKFGLQFGLISIEDVISKSIQDIQPQAKDKQITIIQNTVPLPKIWGDEERLIQVLTNLLANALKFTPQNGTITITTYESANEVKISVKDTGIGIPADKLSRIFDRFYQIDGSNSRKYGGTGLGLSICKSIVESHYGSIWAESDDSGSTFHIVLPKLESKLAPDTREEQ